MSKIKVEIEVELPTEDESKFVERQRVSGAVHKVGTRIGEESNEGHFVEGGTDTQFKLKEVSNE